MTDSTARAFEEFYAGLHPARIIPTADPMVTRGYYSLTQLKEAFDAGRGFAPSEPSAPSREAVPYEFVAIGYVDSDGVVQWEPSRTPGDMKQGALLYVHKSALASGRQDNDRAAGQVPSETAKEPTGSPAPAAPLAPLAVSEKALRHAINILLNLQDHNPKEGDAQYARWICALEVKRLDAALRKEKG